MIRGNNLSACVTESCHRFTFTPKVPFESKDWRWRDRLNLLMLRVPVYVTKLSKTIYLAADLTKLFCRLKQADDVPALVTEKKKEQIYWQVSRKCRSSSLGDFMQLHGQYRLCGLWSYVVLPSDYGDTQWTDSQIKTNTVSEAVVT